MKNFRKHNKVDFPKENVNFDFCWNYYPDDGSKVLSEDKYKELLKTTFSYDPGLHGFDIFDNNSKNQEY